MPTIKTVLDLDSSKMESKAHGAAERVGKTVSEQFSRAVEKKVGTKDAIKSLVAGIGISAEGIAERLARAFTGMSEDVEDAYKRIVDASARASAALDQMLSRRRTPDEEIAALDRKTRSETRSPGMKEQTYGQRVLSQLPIVGGYFKNHQEQHNTFSGEEIMATRGEESARAIENRAAAEELRLRAKDAARAKADMAAQHDAASSAYSGTNTRGETQTGIRDLARQERDLRKEAAEATTSHVRKEELLLKAEQLLVRQLQIGKQYLDAERGTREKLADVQEEADARGETTAERVVRLKRDALIMDERSHDLFRGDDERRGLRVQAAQKLAQAAKEEYEYRYKALSIQEGGSTPAGRSNTTTQGVRARRAASYREKAKRFQQMGRYDSAAKYGDLANQLENDFEVTDRSGMAAALSKTAPNAAKTMAGSAGRGSSATSDPASAGKLNSIDSHLKNIETALKPADATK